MQEQVRAALERNMMEEEQRTQASVDSFSETIKHRFAQERVRTSDDDTARVGLWLKGVKAVAEAQLEDVAFDLEEASAAREKAVADRASLDQLVYEQNCQEIIFSAEATDRVSDAWAHVQHGRPFTQESVEPLLTPQLEVNQGAGHQSGRESLGHGGTHADHGRNTAPPPMSETGSPKSCGVRTPDTNPLWGSQPNSPALETTTCWQFPPTGSPNFESHPDVEQWVGSSPITTLDGGSWTSGADSAGQNYGPAWASGARGRETADDDQFRLEGQYPQQQSLSQSLHDVPPVYHHSILAVERYGWHEVHDGTPQWTALHWAATEGRPDLCARLLRARADPTHPDHCGRSALEHARDRADPLTWQLLAAASGAGPLPGSPMDWAWPAQCS